MPKRLDNGLMVRALCVAAHLLLEGHRLFRPGGKYHRDRKPIITAVIHHLLSYSVILITPDPVPNYKFLARNLICVAYADSNEYRGRSIIVKTIAPAVVDTLAKAGVFFVWNVA